MDVPGARSRRPATRPSDGNHRPADLVGDWGGLAGKGAAVLAPRHALVATARAKRRGRGSFRWFWSGAEVTVRGGRSAPVRRFIERSYDNETRLTGRREMEPWTKIP